jgi:hypothetical protein
MSGQPKKSKKRAAKNPPIPSITASSLQATAESLKKGHLKAARTTASYQGHITRGQKFIRNLQTDTVSPQGLPQDVLDSAIEEPEGLKVALDGIPTKLSPDALACYLVYKSEKEKRGESTSDGIHAAFKDHWSQMCVTNHLHSSLKC